MRSFCHYVSSSNLKLQNIYYQIKYSTKVWGVWCYSYFINQTIKCRGTRSKRYFARDPSRRRDWPRYTLNTLTHIIHLSVYVLMLSAGSLLCRDAFATPCGSSTAWEQEVTGILTYDILYHSHALLPSQLAKQPKVGGREGGLESLVLVLDQSRVITSYNAGIGKIQPMAAYVIVIWNMDPLIGITHNTKTSNLVALIWSKVIQVYKIQ